MTKITGIIIIALAALIAIFCLIFKIKINPDRNKKTMKAKFLLAVSVMMSFFIGFFSTSCGSDDKIVQIPTPTPTYRPLCYTPAITPMPTCYTPTVAPIPTCYTPAPSQIQTSSNGEKSILYQRLSLIEEISQKNTVKDNVLKMAKENILNQIDLLDEKNS